MSNTFKHKGYGKYRRGVEETCDWLENHRFPWHKSPRGDTLYTEIMKKIPARKRRQKERETIRQVFKHDEVDTGKELDRKFGNPLEYC